MNPPASRPGTARVGEERGGATALAALVVAVVVGVTALLAVHGVLVSAAQRVRGAADLAALAGARAQGAGADACAAAGRSATLAGVVLGDCRVVGDEVEFVVRVGVRTVVTLGPWSQRVEAHANAGLVTGAPE